MNDGQTGRQQIVERIKGSSNILVTVGTNPSVDALSAALGLTIMLNAMSKHATAVVSGDIPPAIEFLEPGKTFENTVDSLRDFIIALDKEKADHLRYKVDGDVVKIFITPYRTTLTSDDLDFSQGDYNVELVVALGVSDKEHLDKALASHGRILHDATVATLSCGQDSSTLGSLDWHDSNASSLSEMLVALSEALKTDKPLLDEQSASAFLTGIVAATDRFSNNQTSSKVMTMAAQLMAAGANQQLIAAKLEEAHEIGDTKKPDDSNDNDDIDGTTDLKEGESSKVNGSKKSKKEPKKDDGTLEISHEKEGTVDEVAEQIVTERQEEATDEAEEQLSEELSAVAPPASTPSVADLQKDLESASADIDEAAQQSVVPESVLPPVQPVDDEPTLGGTLNATTEQAHEDSQAELDKDRNKTILTHNAGSYVGNQQPTFQQPFNAANNTSSEEPRSVDIFDNAAPTVKVDPANPPAQAAPDTSPETLEEIDRKNRAKHHEQAQADVAAAFDALPFDPANQPVASVGAQPLGDIPHDAPASTPVTEAVQTAQPLPASPFDALPPVPQSGPIDFSTLPPPPPLPSFDHPHGPLPPEQLGQILPLAEQPEQKQQQTPAPADPTQFKIPGQ